MLSLNDLSRVDWDALDAGLATVAARRGLEFRQGQRFLGQKYETPREGDHIIAPKDFRATERDLIGLDADSKILAQAADAVALVRRFLADERSGRPAAVVELSAGEPPAAQMPTAKAAPSFAARALTAFAALTGGPSRKDGAA